MSTNPLKSAAAPASTWTAMDYYRCAVENGRRDLAALWLAEAKKRGEIPDCSDGNR
jgi:hypothetical protein